MAASATWQQTPSRTKAPRTTVLSISHQLAPRVTPPATYGEPNEVVIDLTTTLLIPDYARFYDAPILAFQPAYVALPDGSLATTTFMDDLARSYLSLLVTGMLATLFLRNILVSFDYIRRGKMKRKTLFYLLLCSQLLALGLVPLLTSYFSQRLNCTMVMLVASAATGVSLTLLMTGVLGLKAYRCLDSSRVVSFFLAAFFCASSAFMVLQLTTIRGLRRLSGSCSTISLNRRFIQIYVLVQLAHSFFICCCFFYAVWKSRASPAARGRISIQVSLEDFPDINSEKPTRRIWWEHATKPKPNIATVVLPSLDVSCGTTQQELSPDVGQLLSNKEQITPVRARRKPSAPGPFHMLRGFHRISDPILEQPLNPAVNTQGCRRPYSFHHLIPRMELFHKVMKDELCYTTTISVTTLVVALLLVFGVSFENSLDMTGWIAANWAVTSILVIHSFGRVVRRHERDALLQHPSAWWDRDISNHRSPYSRSRFPGSPLRVRVPGEDEASDNPFSDTRGLRESTISWNSEFTGSPSSPTPVAFTRDRKLSLSSAYPDFPSSNRNTPLDLVPHDSTDPTFIPFLNSWHKDGDSSTTNTRLSVISADEKASSRSVSHVPRYSP
ncbi:hypothetical protein B0H10DRAFT_1995557 [Mycena sp. CBHHK59/15]|nr:hypothetical protein B0H10DRAFT_1995557 [Mycena sp. CBHHK59/15]